MEILRVEVEPYSVSSEPQAKRTGPEVRKRALTLQPPTQPVSLDEDTAGAFLEFTDVEFSYDDTQGDQRGVPLLKAFHSGSREAKRWCWLDQVAAARRPS